MGKIAAFKTALLDRGEPLQKLKRFFFFTVFGNPVDVYEFLFFNVGFITGCDRLREKTGKINSRRIT